ncbi:MAG TPA: transcription-repair coupling factor [Nocardioidaceae bacterium]|nr:transcription-repair coupling factor [Nocardioidaceae bacterium]
MSLQALTAAVAAEPTLATALARARTRQPSTLDLTAPAAMRPFIAAALASPPAEGGADKTVLVVTATTREADEITAALQSLLDPHHVVDFQPWETLPHERLSPRSDTVGRRLAVLRRLAHPDESGPSSGRVTVLVAPVRSVLQPLVAGLGDLEPVALRTGEEADLDDVVRRLSAAAYSRVDLVERRGEFAVRGGIVDVFPPTEEHPVRVEFFGDEVEEIRAFAVADQRSLDVSPHGLWAPPCRELLLTDDVRARARGLAEAHPQLRDMLDKLAEGHAVEGMESLAPVLVDEMELLVDQLPEETVVVVCDPERVRGRAHDLVATSAEFLSASWAAAAGGGTAPIDLGAAAFRTLADVRTYALSRGMSWWSVSPFGLAALSPLGEGPDPSYPGSTALEPLRTETGDIVSIDVDTSSSVEAVALDVRAAETYRGDTEAAVADIAAYVRKGSSVVLVTEGHGPGQRLVEVLQDNDIAARLVDELGAAHLTPGSSSGVVEVAQGSLQHGFLAETIGLAVLTGDDLMSQRTTAKTSVRMPSRRRKQVDPLELLPGDYVVHEQHGVGRYVEMIQRTVAGATREYLLIEYAASKRGQPADRLFVPTDQLDQVTRYVGGEHPSLDRLGGADWNKRKGRARKAVRQIAAELIKLYAARQATRGHAFGPDTPWQRELEDAFPYVETPDQLASVDEVKRDMEQPIPMDRLICGDVGYGKTEIAVRAAFKAVQDGKQVAILVPTTLLVQQHQQTFAERFAGFPVNVRSLSRFQTDAEAQEVIAGLAAGSIDVVIGTHRLFNAEVKLKDLGLVIVDEEQRFGVEHKEALKQMRTAVDVLSMSATPIPRTLEMAITGIREMSTITTPPEERHPVLTFVGNYDAGQITAAIRRELLREGQVFYIHNRVQSIDKAAARLSQLVPEARIVAAHGQMREHQLEQVMLDFWERKFDVLVCTTIVESGLDVANANSLIIERADLLGLSQLHQLRGRVGRGGERAYAYFLYPPEKPLTETAHDRLATIAQHSDLGAGMAVAMKDLEIRGAGNLLGGEQSGHIADVGFDLYVRLVGEAVAEYRGDAPVDEPEVKVELPVDAHLPHTYVPSERLRLEMYKRLAEVRSLEQIAEVRSELGDRYGPPPVPVDNLLAVAVLRVKARAAKLTDVNAQGNFVRFSPVDLPDSRRARLNRLYPKSVVKATVHSILVPRPMSAGIAGQPVRDVAVLDWAGRVIDDVIAEPAG